MSNFNLAGSMLVTLTNTVTLDIVVVATFIYCNTHWMFSLSLEKVSRWNYYIQLIGSETKICTRTL